MKRRITLLIIGAAISVALFAFSGCTSILGTFEVTDTGEGGVEGGVGKALGEACAAATECGSGQCVDGVCCETACDGTCEACNLPTLVGKCMPIPDGEDPQNECPTIPLPEAGPEDAGIIFDDGGDAGDNPDATVVDPDAAPPFELPDGGVTTEDNQCAGKCNGKRACAFPGKERTCGSVVCGNKTTQGRAACDGEGHCLFGSEPCEAYACPDGKAGCVKTCAGPDDCLATHFCDPSNTCKPKLDNGAVCTSAAQCKTGFCVDGVCCNSECNGFPGATCTKQGSIGTCQCTACPSGPCQLYYRDEDGDTFGDKYGTIQNGRAAPGCVSGPPPAGFVANKQDCFDGTGPVAAAVRPNQTGFFPSGSIPAEYTAPGQAPSNDFNCDGLITKETPEYLNGSCKFCRKPFGQIISCTSTTTSCTNGEAAGLACTSPFCISKPGIPCNSCQTITTTAFTQTTDCGVSRVATNCGYCSNNAITGTTFPTVQQRCR